MSLSWTKSDLTKIGKHWFALRVVDELNMLGSRIVIASILDTVKQRQDEYMVAFLFFMKLGNVKMFEKQRIYYFQLSSVLLHYALLAHE